MKINLETERLLLREFTEADVDVLIELNGDPVVMRHLTGGAPVCPERIRQEVLPRFLRYHAESPQTKTGVLTFRQAGEVIEFDFPAMPATEAKAPDGLLSALGVRPSFVGRSKFDKYLVVEAEDVVRSLEPNFHALRGIANLRGVSVTSTSGDPRFDFLFRYFAPAAGVDEDPVCGSAQCFLGPFWAERLGKGELTASPASPRGGLVRVRLNDDQVILGGKAVTV